MTEDALTTDPATGLSYRQRGTAAFRACVETRLHSGGHAVSEAMQADFAAWVRKLLA